MRSEVCAEPDIWTPILYFQELKGARVMEGSVELKQQLPTEERQVCKPHCRQFHVQRPSGAGTVATNRSLGNFLGGLREDYSFHPQERKEKTLPHPHLVVLSEHIFVAFSP